MILQLIIICFSITYIISHSGIVFDLSKFIWKLTHPNKDWTYQIIGKPFSCSICMTFWVTLGFLLFNSVGLIYSLGIASLMAICSILVDKIIGLIIKLINKIE